MATIDITNKETLLSTLKKIGSYILDGLSEREACVLVGVDTDQFAAIKEKSKEIQNFLEQQHIMFKHNHLKEISSKKSDKNSQWILEKLRPKEFGTKKDSGEVAGNILAAMIKQIQNDHAGNQIIKEADAKEVESSGAKTAIREFSVDSVLN